MRDDAGKLWIDHDLVFTTSIGTPIEPRSLNTHWEGIRVPVRGQPPDGLPRRPAQQERHTSLTPHRTAAPQLLPPWGHQSQA